MAKDVKININGDSSGLKNALKTGKKAFDSFSIAGTLGAIGVTAGIIKMGKAIIGFGADVVKIGADFEKTMAGVRAISGDISDTAFQQLTDKARELGATTAFSAQEAAQGLDVLARSGMDANSQMDTIQSTLLLAGSNATSMDTAAGALVSTMKQFNMDASESSRVADIFGAAASSSMFSVEGLATSMKFGGTSAAGMGIALEEAIAAQMQLRNVGLDASQAGTTYRGVLVELTKGTDKQTAVLKKYGLTMDDISPKTKTFGEIVDTVAKSGLDLKGGEAFTLFGTKAGAGMGSLIQTAREGSNEFDKFTETLKNSAGTVEAQYAIMMDTVAGKQDIVKSSNEELKLSFFDAMGGATKTVLDDVANVLQMIGSVIRRNKVPLENMFNAVVQVFKSFSAGKDEVSILEIAIIAFGNIFATIMGVAVAVISQFKFSWLNSKALFLAVVDSMIMGIASMIDSFLSGYDILATVVGVFSDSAEKKMKGAMDGVRNFSDGLKLTVKEDADHMAGEYKKLATETGNAYKAVGDIFVAVNSIKLEKEKETQKVLEETTGIIKTQTPIIEENTTATKNSTIAVTEQTSALGDQTEKTQKQIDAENTLFNNRMKFTGTGGKVLMPTFQKTEKIKSIDELFADDEASSIATASEQYPLTQFLTKVEVMETAFDGVKQVGVDAFKALGDSLGTFITDVGTGAKSIGTAFVDMFKGFAKSILSMLSKVAAKMAVMGIAKAIFGGATSGFGAAVMKAVGFQSGGFTGTGRDSEIAGIVHKNEYVVDAQTMRRPGVAEMLAGLKAPQATGNRTVNVAIEDSPMKDIYVNMLRPGGALREAFEQLDAKVIMT